MHTWFIFTTTGAVATLQADSITKAVSSFRQIKHAKAGEIVGVIKAGATVEAFGRIIPTSVFGVICCCAEPPGGTQTIASAKP